VATAGGQGLVWTTRDIRPNQLHEAATALFREGVTVRAVAAKLGITKSTAGRLRLKAYQDGLLDSDDDEPETVH